MPYLNLKIRPTHNLWRLCMWDLSIEIVKCSLWTFYSSAWQSANKFYFAGLFWNSSVLTWTDIHSCCVEIQYGMLLKLNRRTLAKHSSWKNTLWSDASTQLVYCTGNNHYIRWPHTEGGTSMTSFACLWEAGQRYK